jgi:hypothetical protein
MCGVCVCMCLCVCVCVCVCVCACVCQCVYVCIDVCVSVYVLMCVRLWILICVVSAVYDAVERCPAIMLSSSHTPLFAGRWIVTSAVTSASDNRGSNLEILLVEIQIVVPRFLG